MCWQPPIHRIITDYMADRISAVDFALEKYKE